MSIVQRQRLAIEAASQEGRPLKPSDFGEKPCPHGPATPTTTAKRKPPKKPQTGLGMGRSTHKPIPRKYTLEEAANMRVLHELGIGYRVISLMYGCAPGCAHHAVTRRGAYKGDP
jgi:hypothetical protein